MQSDAALLDELKEKFDLENDSQIAAFLGVTRGSIHIIRNRNGKLGIKGRLKILDKIYYRNATNLVQKLTPKYISEQIQQINAFLLPGFVTLDQHRFESLE